MATVINPGDPGRALDQTVPGKATMGYAFRGNGLPEIIVAQTGSSINTQLPRNNRGDDCVRIYNPSDTAVRIKFGTDASEVAVAQSRAIAPGSVEIFNIGSGVQYIATLGAAGKSIEIGCGRGI